MTYDVIIIGGSYAGMAAGLQLARARRRVLVVDAGIRRNRFAETSHGFLTQDGASPSAVAATGKSQLMAYDTVTWITDEVSHAETTEDGFRIATSNTGQEEKGKRLVLAMGVRDELPSIPGIEERWGKSVFHCPYCHGYEIHGGPIGVLATSPNSIHHALMLPDWGPTTFFLNGTFTPDQEQARELEERGVAIDEGQVERLEGAGANIIMRDGRRISLAGLFVMPKSHVSSPIAEQLGCAFDEGPMGSFIRTDGMKATTVPGVFACGDAARMAGSVTFAVGDGALAGMAAHRSLIFER